MVTGGEGFLGSRIVARLRGADCETVFVPAHSEYDLVLGPNIAAAFDDARPDIVIHLAAVVGGIGANQKTPGEFFFKNLIMGALLMEEARLRGVEKFVAIGTICAYPKHTPVPFSEDRLWDGYPEETNAPYGLAKKMMLVQAQAYRQEYDFNAIYLLPVNLYGPGDNADPETSHVIPALIRKCLEAVRDGRDEVVVWGTGNATREFLYVDDAADGIVMATELYDDPAPVNIGTGRSLSIADLTSLIARRTGFHGTIRWDPTRPDGQPARQLDVSRARERFGFSARTTLEAGLDRTIEWMRATMPSI
jgi:GDP-L-fucose synthase